MCCGHMVSFLRCYESFHSFHGHLLADYFVPGIQVVFVSSYRRFGKLTGCKTRDMFGEK